MAHQDGRLTRIAGRKRGPPSGLLGHRVRQRHVDHAQLNAFVALPAVDRQRPGHMHDATAALEQGMSELLPGDAERDGVEGGAVYRPQAGAHMSIADLFGVGDGVSRSHIR